MQQTETAYDMQLGSMAAAEYVLIGSNSNQLLYIGSATVTRIIATESRPHRCAPLMRPLLFIAILLFAACHEKGCGENFEVTKFIPDSTNSFYAKQFYEDYKGTRAIERLLDLGNISNGSEKTELRLWNLSSSYDPQSIYIVKKIGLDEWKLRFIRYDASLTDGITSEINMVFRNDFIAMLNVEQFWNVKSQSEMTNGDSFGCMDGNTVLLELSDASRYKYILFRCPEIQAAKDSAFYYVTKLSAQLRSIAREE